MFDAFIRKMELLTSSLGEEDKAALLAGVGPARVYEAGEDIVREGDRPERCCLILSGFACRYKLLPSGKRQILSFHIAGDIADLHGIGLSRMDHSICAIARSQVGFIEHTTIQGWVDTQPNITRALWRDTLVDAAIFREWITNIGARDTLERLAHVLCEIKVRMECLGLLRDEDSYELPLTQAEIGDAIGASLVHVNRVLQELRRDELISFKNRTVVIKDWERLSHLGQFDPSYLQIPGGREAAESSGLETTDQRPPTPARAHRQWH